MPFTKGAFIRNNVLRCCSIVGRSPTFAYWRKVGYQTRTVFVQAATGIAVQSECSIRCGQLSPNQHTLIQCTAVAREITVVQCVIEAAMELGYSSMKPEQVEVAVALIEGRDVFAILPTGFGKSLLASGV